jgi:hypothetical protein
MSANRGPDPRGGNWMPHGGWRLHGDTIYVSEEALREARAAVDARIAEIPESRGGFRVAKPTDFRRFDFLFPELQVDPDNLLPESQVTVDNLVERTNGTHPSRRPTLISGCS